MDKASILKKLLGLGSQTAPEVIEKAAPIAKRVSTEAAEVAPEVIGKGTSRAAKAVDDVMDANWRELTPEPKKVSSFEALLQSAKENPKTAALLTSMVGGTAASKFFGGDEEPPKTPSINPIPAAEPLIPDNKLTPDATSMSKKTVNTEPPKKDGLDFDALAKKFDHGMAGLPKDEVSTTQASPEDFRSMFKAAMTERDNGLSDANFLRAAERVSAGLSRTKAEHGSSDIKRQQAENAIKDFQTETEAMQTQQQYDNTKAQLNDETKMRDSNSEISKLVSDLAVKTGLIKPGQQVSAMSLKNAGVNLGTLLATMEAGKARKEAAALAQQSALKEKEGKLTERQRKFTQGLRKEATTGVLGKQYATYSTGQRMQSSLEQFAQDPSGYKDYATLMGGLKSLQGDESVVREAEVRLGINATSAINKAFNYAQSAMNGKQLQPEQRQEMIDTIKILTDASKQQYMQSVKPILEQAQMEGIEPGLILSGSLSGAKQESNPEAPQAETKVFKQNLNPGSTVTTKSGKKYSIGADGQTGTLIK